MTLRGFWGVHTLYGLGSFTSVLRVNTKVSILWPAWFCGVFWLKWLANHFQRSPLASFRKSLITIILLSIHQHEILSSRFFISGTWIVLLTISKMKLNLFTHQLHDVTPQNERDYFSQILLFSSWANANLYFQKFLQGFFPPQNMKE